MIVTDTIQIANLVIENGALALLDGITESGGIDGGVNG
jgi:hypothetical protein